MARRLVVDSSRQIAELYEGLELIRVYRISTATNGLGCSSGTDCTPRGRLRVAEKIGEGAAIGTVFRGRVPTGERWPETVFPGPESDLVLTRILWLEGAEEQNQNTLERLIYLHGTQAEDRLGTPCSHGCIRFANADIVDLFDRLPVGAEVEVI